MTDGGIAAKAGLKTGDKVIRLGAKKVASMDDVRAALRDGPAKTAITVVRAGNEITVDIVFPQ